VTSGVEVGVSAGSFASLFIKLNKTTRPSKATTIKPVRLRFAMVRLDS
jgi:hypothetical protein